MTVRPPVYIDSSQPVCANWKTAQQVRRTCCLPFYDFPTSSVYQDLLLAACSCDIVLWLSSW